MNIPNVLTLLRILLVPVVVIFLIQDSYLKALIVFAFSGITDALDGFLARILNQQTTLGAYLDPIADKALIMTCFLTLSILGHIPGWLTVIVVSRDSIILLGILVLTIMEISFKIHPTFVSKVTTALQIFTVFFVLISQCIPGNFEQTWLIYLYWLTALFTIISGLNYISTGIKVINHESS
jgi:cardiolipin synthase